MSLTIDGQRHRLTTTADQLKDVLHQNFTQERINHPQGDEAGRYQLEGALSTLGENLNVSNRPPRPDEYNEKNEDRFWVTAVILTLGSKTELKKLGTSYKVLPNGEVDYESGFDLTPVRAFKHWLYGKGVKLRVDFEEVMAPTFKRLNGKIIDFNDFYYMCAHGYGEYQVDELRWPVTTPDDWDLVFGNVNFKFIGKVIFDKDKMSAEGVYKCYDDTYDFHGSGHRTPISEARVRFVDHVINGTDYNIEIRGEIPTKEEYPTRLSLNELRIMPGANKQKNKYTKFTKIK